MQLATSYIDCQEYTTTCDQVLENQPHVHNMAIQLTTWSHHIHYHIMLTDQIFSTFADIFCDVTISHVAQSATVGCTIFTCVYTWVMLDNTCKFKLQSLLVLDVTCYQYMQLQFVRLQKKTNQITILCTLKLGPGSVVIQLTTWNQVTISLKVSQVFNKHACIAINVSYKQ